MQAQDVADPRDPLARDEGGARPADARRLGGLAPFRLSFLDLVRLNAGGDGVDLVEQPLALLLAIRLGGAGWRG